MPAMNFHSTPNLKGGDAMLRYLKRLMTRLLLCRIFRMHQHPRRAPSPAFNPWAGGAWLSPRKEECFA